MKPNNLDLEIKQKLETRLIEPGAQSWDRLDSMLNATEKTKSKPSRTWIYVAASFAALLLTATIYYHSFETNTIQKSNPIVLERTEDMTPQKRIEETQDEKVIGENRSSNSLASKGIDANVDKNKSANRKEEQTEVPGISNQINDKSIVNNNSGNKINGSPRNNKYISPEALLASVSNTTIESIAVEGKSQVAAQSFKVNPNSLLSTAETELNQTFREKALSKLGRNFNTIKTVLVNRNYEE
jgi:hypothetical protein